MKNMKKCLALLAVALSAAVGASAENAAVANSPVQENEPIGVIVDTDLGSSTDDLFALAILRMMETNRLCRTLGVIVDRPYGTEDGYPADCFRIFAEAFLHAYGMDHVPIGTVPAVTGKGAQVFTPYWRMAFPGDQVGEMWGEPPLPPPATREGIVTNGVTLYRMILADAAGESVDICVIGFLSTLVGLMDSPADDISPLTGMELIAAKVRTLRIMAGSFDGALEHPEYNVWGDIASASKVLGEWPGRIVDTPYEVGSRIYLPRAKVLKAAEANDPIALAYTYWEPDITPGYKSQLMWDVCTVLGMPEIGTSLFRERGPGRIVVAQDGYTTFQPNSLTGDSASEPGQQTFVQELTNSLAGTVIRDAIQLKTFGKVTPDPAREFSIRISAVCSSNVVAGGFVNISNRSSEDFDLSGCHLSIGRVEDSNIIRYDFPTPTVIRAGATLTLRGAECWPGRAVWNAPMNVLLYAADWDVLHDTRVDPGWLKDTMPADGFPASREDKGLMVDREDWSAGCGSRHFTAENGLRATIHMNGDGMPVVEPADDPKPETYTIWGAPDLSGVWLTPADLVLDRFFRLTRGDGAD